MPLTKTDISPRLYMREITPPGRSVCCRSVIRSNLIPVDHMPKRGNVVGSTILVIEVVHMLPNIIPEYRNLVLLIH